MSTLVAVAQKPTIDADDKPAGHHRALSLDQKTEKMGEVTIKGQKVPYKVTASTQPVWNEEGKAVAGLFYVYYRSSRGSTRPASVPSIRIWPETGS